MKLSTIGNRFFRSIRFIWYHPLVVRNRLSAFLRYFTFHFSNVFYNSEQLVDFVGNTKILISKDLNGASTNYFTYLSDCEEMIFLLHLLKSKDIFVDVGCNVGIWTILASGVSRSYSIAFEPVLSTYKKLQKHLEINHLNDKVSFYNIAVGNNQENIYLTKNLGALNRVDLNGDGIKVSQNTLDNLIRDKIPKLIKIDVEGFEDEVLKGAKQILENKKLKAIIIELNGSAIKYGSSNLEIHTRLLKFGFFPINYNPFKRSINVLDSFNKKGHNTIYIRDLSYIENIVTKASYLKIGEMII